MGHVGFFTILYFSTKTLKKKNVLEIRIFHIIMSLMMETKYVCAKIEKKYKKLAKECNFQFFRNKTYLITDSKGDCVKRVSPSIGRFKIISKKGTNFADNDFIRSVAEKIKEDKPIILF